MLSSLLPGLRELRAPFAAGVLWLLAAWVLCEPLIPTRDDANKMSGLANSFYRLDGLVPDVALGAAAGFIAYLLGSLSVALLSDPLRSSFRVSLSPNVRMLNPLSESTVRALHRLARRTRTEIETLLAPRGRSVEEFLEVEREAATITPGGSLLNRTLERISSIAIVKRVRQLWDRALTRICSTKFVESILERLEEHRRRRRKRLIMSHLAPPPPEAVTEHELAELAVLDLDVVTTARLLGKDPELYSAIDRHRAEVEFRFGVIPPLLLLFVAVSLRLPKGWIAAMVVLVGVLAVIGLYWDALKKQREANGLLVDAAVHKRVELPSLERLRANAQHVGKTMTSGEAAWRVDSEIARAIAVSEKLDSFASSAAAAAAAFDQTRRYFTLLGPQLEPPLRDAASLVLESLESTIDLWNKGVRGQAEQGWTDEGKKRRAHAIEQLKHFRTLLRPNEALTAVSAPEQLLDGAQTAALPGL